MRKLRITALILVCLGLLIGGIGIGMCFVEASSFTYRDTVRLNMTQTDTVFTSIYLDEEEKLTGYEIYDSNSQNIVLSPDAQIPQIQTDSRGAGGGGVPEYSRLHTISLDGQPCKQRSPAHPVYFKRLYAANGNFVCQRSASLRHQKSPDWRIPICRDHRRDLHREPGRPGQN